MFLRVSKVFTKSTNNKSGHGRHVDRLQTHLPSLSYTEVKSNCYIRVQKAAQLQALTQFLHFGSLKPTFISQCER